VSDIPSPEQVFDAIIELAERFPGQPVAVIRSEDGLQIQAGVLSLMDLQPEDWFWLPVHLVDLPASVAAAPK
jgi:hypothetical protein